MLKALFSILEGRRKGGWEGQGEKAGYFESVQ